MGTMLQDDNKMGMMMGCWDNGKMTRTMGTMVKDDNEMGMMMG
jgi:hypothetical protein